MLRKFAGIAGLLMIAAVPVANAQSSAQRTTDIRAGIVVIDSAQTPTAKQPINYTPFVWESLDSDTAVKPAGWNIYNPAASTQVTPQIWTRWNGIAADLGGPTPVLNARISKRDAPYWEVLLSQVSDEQLSRYDLLELSAYGYTNLNSIERDKLRKFVDQGGVLWIDIASSTNFGGVQVNTLPLPFQAYDYGGSTAYSYYDAFSPLTTTPYALSLQNMEQMRVDRSSFAQPIDLTALSMSGFAPIESWIETDYAMHFTTVAASTNYPSVMMGKLGDGYIVVTTSENAMALNRVGTGSTYSANNQYRALAPTFDRTTQIAAKFAVNLAYLASGFNTPGGGARNARSEPTDLQPPMLRVTSASVPNISASQGAVTYKGLLVVTAGHQVKVYDVKPRTDLDGDGNPDDGIQDLSLGNEYDELWESADLGTQLSPPTCGEVPGSATSHDQIFVVGENGVLYAFDAFDLTNGTINPTQSPAAPIYTINPPVTSKFDTGEPGPGPYAPTLHDGLLYISDVQQSPTTGVVWVADPVSQATVKTFSTTDDWYVGANGAQTLPEPTGSPTIGYIPVQDNSGGYDRVMYIPGRPTSAMGPTGMASITSLWMGVRGESPPPNSVTFNPPTSPTSMQVITRAGTQGLRIYNDTNVPAGELANRALGIKLTMLYANGQPFTNADMQKYFKGSVDQSAGAGILTFAMNGNDLPPGSTARLDYSIDWGTGDASATTRIIRGQLYLPGDYVDFPAANDRQRIIGNIAMSPRGTIYCITSTLNETSSTQDCGSFYAIREDIGRGGFRLLTRYQLYPDHVIPLNQAAPASVAGTVVDSDPVTNFMPAFMQSQSFSHLTFVGSPAVRGDTVFVTAGARKAGGGIAGFVPYTVLMAFQAEPTEPEIRIGNIPSGFTLRQYDVDRSSSHTAPTAANDFNQGQFSYNRGEGVIRFNNLMTTNRGVMVNAFSTSQPVVLRRPDAPDQVIYPDSLGNKWSPLQWYAVMHGVEPTAAPIVTGGSVFVPGKSVLPNIAQMIANGTIQLSGMVEAWNANVSPTDAFLGTPDGSRPWIRQLYQVTFSGTGPSGNPDLLWPQITHLRDFADYIVRVRQTKLGNSSDCYGIAGGQSALAAWGDKGVYGFTKADFLIADEGRLARFDANGNPLWVADMSSNTGPVNQGAVGTVQSLVRPVKAYSLGTGDMLVVDTGGNRIARLDTSGQELRSISSFTVDPTNVPDGFQANEPLTLNGPRDVAVFTTYEANGTQYWSHYLIADTGNKRIVDVVDKYSVNANRQVTGVIALGVLNWHSPTNYSGKNFDYNSISRVYEPTSGRYYYACGIGSALPTRVNSGLDSPDPSLTQQRESVSGNGGIVIFDPTTPNNNIVINQVIVPPIAANTFWDFSTGSFNSPAKGGAKYLSNVNSVTTRVINIGGDTRIAIMFTDATGVYEIYQPTGTDWQVRWMLPNEAYRAMRRIGNNAPMASNPMDLRATYARRLDDDDVLIVNGYVGTTRGDGVTPPADFNGEVIQVDGDFDATPTNEGFDFNKPNLGFDLGMIVFQLPPINGARGLVLPVFADRR